MNHNLQRFEKAHQKDFKTALEEVRNGMKISHWMWYIFPQVRGLGFSEISGYYAIENLREAREFLDHPILGKNLLLITAELLKLETKNATIIFGNPDNIKLRSSMTLFSLIRDTSPVFQEVLDKYFGGVQDPQTIRLLAK